MWYGAVSETQMSAHYVQLNSGAISDKFNVTASVRVL